MAGEARHLSTVRGHREGAPATLSHPTFYLLAVAGQGLYGQVHAEQPLSPWPLWWRRALLSRSPPGTMTAFFGVRSGDGTHLAEATLLLGPLSPWVTMAKPVRQMVGPLARAAIAWPIDGALAGGRWGMAWSHPAHGTALGR